MGNIWSGPGRMWDMIVVGAPLLMLRGYAAMEYSEGVLNVFYYPAKRYRKTQDRFLEKVAWFGARAMDRMLRREDVDQVYLWAEGKLPLEDGSGKRVWKGARLVLDKTGQRDAGMRSLSDLAAVDPHQYLTLCSFQWLDATEFPRWPKVRRPR